MLVFRSLRCTVVILSAAALVLPRAGAQVEMWTRCEGPTLGVGPGGGWDGGGIHAGDVVRAEGADSLFYSAADVPNVGGRIGMTSSDDPCRFENAPDPILGGDLGGMWGIGSPTVLFDPTSKGFAWWMWYQAIRVVQDVLVFEVRLAGSVDGASWEPVVDDPVLTRDPASPWEGDGPGNPSVLLFDAGPGKYRMWYEAGSGSTVSTWKIGLATSEDGIAWTRCESNPILASSGIDGEDGVYGTEVIYDAATGTYEMWYTAASTSGPHTIAYATSLDGILWTKAGRIAIDGESRVIGHPIVRRDGDLYHLWYVATASSVFYEELAYATAERTLPLVSFTAVVEGNGVKLDASLTAPPPACSIESYEWDFGDGPVAGGVTVERPLAPGRHILTLTVRDSCGATGANQRRIEVGCPPGEVAPWTASDIGAPRFPGSSSRAGDCFEVCAGAKLLGGTSDQLHFVWEELSGDFSLALRIEAMDGAELGAQLGLIARESLDEGAPMAAVSIRRVGTDDVKYRWNWRATSAAPVGATSGPPVGELPGWVRLDRKGNELIGAYSTDGTVWTELPERRMLGGSPETLLVGIFGIGKEPTGCQSAFEALRGRACLEPEVPPPGPRLIRGGANEDGAVDLSDAVAILGYLFLGGSLDCVDAGDVDDDGKVLITDPIALLNYLFLGGPPPAAPFAECGEDPSEDELGCESFAGCP